MAERHIRLVCQPRSHVETHAKVAWSTHRRLVSTDSMRDSRSRQGADTCDGSSYSALTMRGNMRFSRVMLHVRKRTIMVQITRETLEV